MCYSCARVQPLNPLSLPQGEASVRGILRENGRDVYVDVNERTSEMARRQELPAARDLLHSQLPLEPSNGPLWAQLGNLERRLAKREGAAPF